MKAKDVRVGSVYAAKVSGNIVPVRVDAVREMILSYRREGNRLATVYDVTNLVTKRRTTFKSAAKLRHVWNQPVPRSEADRKADAEYVDALDSDPRWPFVRSF